MQHGQLGRSAVEYGRMLHVKLKGIEPWGECDEDAMMDVCSNKER